jgi:HAE1 family hydrophobic/amphiphilic exporter-1
MNLPALSVKRAVTFTMVFIAVTAFGVLGMELLPLDLFPDITFPVSAIISDYPGASPEDVESLVTRPIEEAVASVAGIENITSQSRQGNSFVVLEFTWGTDMDEAKRSLRENVDLYRDALPSEMRNPLIFAFDPSMMPIAFLGLSGDMPTHELRAIAKDQVEPLLERLPGVASASTDGGLDRQIQVRVDPVRLQAHRIPVQQMVAAIRSENVQLPTGSFDQGNITYAVHTEGRFTSVGQIARTVVGYQGGRPIRVQDVAEVVDGFQDVTSGTNINGTPGVMVLVMKQSDANTVAVSDRVVAELAAINRMLPPGVTLHLIFDQGSFIKRSIGNLANTAVLAFLITALVLFFFLQSVRASAIVALSIPLSILTAFFGMYLVGVTLNIISFAGLALAVGMLVDNSIIVLDNTVRFIQDGHPPMEAAVAGPSEILMAIVASTLTTISVFVPVLFVPGIAGVMFKDMALTICVSLVASLFVAVSLVPLMGSRLLKPAGQLAGQTGRFAVLGERIRHWLERLEERYTVLLGWVLDAKRLVLITTAVLFAVSMGLIAVLGGEFIPQAQEEQVSIAVEREPGTSVTEMAQTMQRLERLALDNTPEVMAVTSRYGAGQGFSAFMAGGTNEGTINVYLVDIGERKRDTVQIRDALDALMRDEPGTKVTLTAGGGMGGGMFSQADLILEIYGQDLEEARRIAEEFAAQLRARPDVLTAESSYEKGRPEMEVVLDRTQKAGLGLTGGAVISTLSTYLRGTVATYLSEEGQEYEILVRAADPYRDRAPAIPDLLVATPTGSQVPLADFISLQPSLSPTSIGRKNQERVVYVNVDVAGNDLRKVTGAVTQMANRYPWPPGFRWGLEGSAQDMMESFMWLGLALLGGALLVYMVMASQFESLLHPFIVILTVPLAMIGVVWALILTGTTLSVVAMIGVILLVGIVVNNSIVLVDYINKLRERGLGLREAVVRAGRRRMRPILMTALTTILAMVPLALEIGTGAEMWAPMGRSVIGGLSVATLLTLLIIPAVYTVFAEAGDRRRVRKAVRKQARQDAAAAGGIIRG